MIPPEVYSPAEDTILLMNASLRIASPEDRVLEIGTGNGEIAVALMDVGARVAATDINPFAASYAHSRGVPVIRCDLFAGICGIFDLILFNPPYLPTTPDERIDDWFEFALDGGVDGRETIQRFLADAPAFLSKNGRILLLISSLTGISEVSQLFADAGMISFVVSEESHEGEKLVVLLGMKDLCRV
ncbi:MAG: Putative methylase [Methanomicrobiales archaeon 53_19]|jgi:release factor glutamine methyltransferase|uniref:HemK2/MTQ2 family protein methyltransferase n=1 Tax=Methanocalculus sp. TaxID=2004547 RepID=UPI00074A138E|nr:HemK2/MTQ2 family protein methyltransferase [Methanocalculus sp.]KUK70970.1 MAG: Putative methylase [Methanocalculus sp. 52_23]KUL04852.1 MAG: Putative methylase [Methanomicrobiales archaeon 53_19]HIJ06100.1 methyltransferase [Methanocalculus sp.]